MKNSIIQISKELLISVKTGNNVDSYLKSLQSINYECILREFKDDDFKKAFWINIYNSLINLKLKDKSRVKLYPKFEFFSISDIYISNLKLSFDDIEHGILRKSEIKYFLGYLPKFSIFISNWEKQLRVDKKDYRIHFALNCGALSCPKNLAYDEKNIESKLETSKESFIKNDSTFDSINNILTISKIFYWFIGDFGGKKGIIQIHKDLNIIPQTSQNVKVKFRDYNWEIDI